MTGEAMDQIKDDFMFAAEVAERLEVSNRTLSRWALLRKGPPRVKIGRKVLYRRASFNAWLDQMEAASAFTAPRCR